MSDLHCFVCGKELSGGLGTFGDSGWELCFQDYFYPPYDEPETLPWQDDIDTTESLLEELRFDLSMAYDNDLTNYQRLELEVDINSNESLLIQYRQWQADSVGRQKQKTTERLDHWKALVS